MKRRSNPIPRPWSRRIPVRLPRTHPDEVLLHQQLPLVMEAMARHGYPLEMLPDLGRRSLTVWQRALADATESSDAVAQDAQIQQFRKWIHLLLDH